MDLSAHRSALKFTSLTFVILLFFLGLSLAANVLAWLRIEDLARGQKETYIPMFFNQPFSLSRNVADASYLQQVAESLMFLRLNVTPESVKAQHQALLRYFDTTTRPQMKTILDGE
ncbi:type IV conjugative transfer system protein TraE, partial [Escherichia coli]|nr:type IV conjugative transfer system protein TraE [Escherichia coli]